MSSSLHALLVEDSIDDAELILHELKRGGYEPFASRVDNAVAMGESLDTGQWDVILADYAMPKFSGLSALKLLQAKGQDIPFIIVSGAIGEETAVSLMKAGAHDYVMKGNLKRLVPAIQRELREAEIRKGKQRDEEQIERLSKFPEENPYPILSATLNGTIVYVNKPGLALIKIQRNSEEKEPLYILPEYLQAQIKETVSKGKSKEVEIVLNERIFSFLLVPILSGNYINLYGRDITDRRKAEEALRASEEKYHKMIEDLPIGIALNDEKGSGPERNRAYMEMHGYTSKEEFKKIPAVELYFDLEDRKLFINKMGEGEVRNFEIRHKRKDGSPFWVSQSSISQIGLHGEKLNLGIAQDIQERKQAEEALKDSEEKFRNLIQNSPVGISMTSVDGRLILVNLAQARMFGFASLTEYQTTNVSTRYYYPEERNRFIELASKGMVKDFEVLGKRKDGSQVWISLTAIPQINERGEKELITITQDISERKQAENDLKASEEKFRSLVENAPIGITVTSLDGRRLDANRAFCEMHGYDSKEEFSKVNAAELYAVPAESEFFLKKLREGSVNDSETTHKRKDGSTFLISLTSIPRTSPSGEKEVITIAQDVTDRKRTEERLKLRATLLDAATSAIILQRMDETLAYVNESAIKMYGHERNTLSGMSLRDLIAPESVPDFDRLVRETLEKKEYRIELIHVRKNGVKFPVEVYATAVVNEGNRFILSIINDVTERKVMETALKKAREEADASNQAKREFLAHMSHEIRTPMNAIVGLSYLALKTELTPKQRDYLNKVQTSADSLMGIINNVLDLSKIEAGKMEIEKTNFRLDQVFGNIVEMFSLRAQEKNIELRFETTPDTPLELVGDPLRLGQVLINLVNNALKFTEKGEIAVSTETISKENDEVRLQFSVRDTGIGMTEEQKSRIFTPFTQADDSMTRRYGGTGLGLTISRRLVEHMGGEISITSEPGVGSVFTFTAVLGIQREKSATGNVVPTALRGLKVLVVDDSTTAAEIMKNALTSMSFNVTVVDSGRAALKELEEANNSYDLVMLDWRMPDMDGFETARRIKSNLHLARSPKIFLVTAYGRQDAIHQAEELGLDAFLVKPLSNSVLFDAIMQSFGDQPKLPVSLSTGTEQRKALAGIRILVAEDNEINQQVATEILESYGATVAIAANGKIAVAMVLDAGAVFDGVLMDLQMPVMEGYEATRIIRTTLKDLPIIAMTAHALQSDVQHCLEGGMNDYVTKPVDPEKLLSTLMRWIKPRMAVHLPTVAATSNATAPTIEVREDVPGIDMANAIKRLMGNRKLFDRLLTDFVRDYGNVTNEIRQAIVEDDTARARRLTHTLKGVAGNLSATMVFSATEKLEEAMRKGDRSGIEAELKHLDGALAPIVENIRQSSPDVETINRTETLEPHPVDALYLAKSLIELDALLKKNNLGARKHFELLREKLPGEQFRVPLMQTEECLTRLDFEEAQEHLASLARLLGIVMNQER